MPSSFGSPFDRRDMVRALLVVFLPLAAVLHYLVHVGSIWVFVAGSIAVAVLADWVRRATEQVAARGASYRWADDHQLRQHRRAAPGLLRAERERRRRRSSADHGFHHRHQP